MSNYTDNSIEKHTYNLHVTQKLLKLGSVSAWEDRANTVVRFINENTGGTINSNSVRRAINAFIWKI